MVKKGADLLKEWGIFKMHSKGELKTGDKPATRNGAWHTPSKAEFYAAPHTTIDLSKTLNLNQSLSLGSQEERLNETMKVEHDHNDEIEVSFMRINSDDELEEHERDGSPVVWITDTHKLEDETNDTNYNTERVWENPLKVESSPASKFSPIKERSTTFVSKPNEY